MGTQQLLLIVLGVIIVGIAIVVGIQMFGQSALEANKNAIVQDVMTLAAKAQQWYRKPTVLGGGGRSFENISFAALGYKDSTTENGRMWFGTKSTNQFVIYAKGKEIGADGDTIQVHFTVYPDSVSSPTWDHQ